jgi:DNA invertase Pin-like site-specific DNA recombinase
MTKPAEVQKNTQAVQKIQRCAIYARYSSDMQRESSIEDQIRKCREYAAKQGWAVEEDYILADRAVSGTSLEGRDAINTLVEAAKQNPRPFDLILIDDTSRLSRNLPQGLNILKSLKFRGAGICSVSQGLDSREPSAYQLFVIFLMMDEQYIPGLADKVHRGQKGRAPKGFIAGGRCYGYRNRPVEDTTRRGDYGRPFVVEVVAEVVPEEADVIRRIFRSYASGLSLDKVAKLLRADGIPAPRPPRRNSVRAWCSDSIAHILGNERYIGVYVWNKTKSDRDENGKIVTRPRPQDEWVRCEIPDWRIVSDELWKSVQAERQLKKRFGNPKNGGLGRTKRSHTYLFSGLMFCGACGGPVNVVDGTTDAAKVLYGCSRHRYKDACSNDVRIRRDRLEEQLLSWLTGDLPNGSLLEEVVTSIQEKVQEQVAALLSAARKHAVNAPELRKELAQLKEETRNISDVIAEMGLNSSTTLRARLQAAEARIGEIENQLTQVAQPATTLPFPCNELRGYLLGRLRDLPSVLASSPLLTKQALRKLIRKITVSPAAEPRRLKVALDFDLGTGGDSAVLQSGTLDAFMQQYGFSTITVTGLTLDASRVRRKPPAPKQTQQPDGGAAMASPPLAADVLPTIGLDIAQTGVAL